MIFLVKNGGTKSGSKGSCLKNKGWKTREESGLQGESPKETKNLKLMLNVTFFDEKLFILIARKVIAELWLFVVYCFVFGVFLSHRLHLVLVSVSSWLQRKPLTRNTSLEKVQSVWKCKQNQITTSKLLSWTGYSKFCLSVWYSFFFCSFVCLFFFCAK